MAQDTPTSYTDGLGIFPSADPLDRNSTHTLARINTISSVSAFAPDNDHASKTMRTKDIEKSPVPHRFKLVLSSTRKHQQQNVSPRPERLWKYKLRGQMGEEENADASFSTSASPFIVDNEPPSPERVCEAVASAHAPMQDLVYDALHSPVFDSFRSSDLEHSPLSRSPRTTSASFTLVQEQSSKRASKRMSSVLTVLHALRETPEPDISTRATTSSTSASILSDVAAVDNNCDGGLAEAANRSEAFELVATPDAVSGMDRTPDCGKIPPSASHHSGPISSFSTHSLQSGNSDNHLAFSHPLSSDSLRSLSRRATDGSLASLMPGGERRFDIRRQAIYAEYGFQLALPASDSDASLRHGQCAATPNSASGCPSKNKPGKKKGHTARSASAYAFSSSVPRSAWSTSTSGASLRSVADFGDIPDVPELPSASGSWKMKLNLAQASEKLEQLAADDDLLALNPLMEEGASIETSTPPRRTCLRRSGSQRCLGRTHRPSTPATTTISAATSTSDGGQLSVLSSSSSTSVAAVNGSVDGSFCSARTSTTWLPLRIVKKRAVTTDRPLRKTMSAGVRDRAERATMWKTSSGHHPIIEGLLRDVDRAIDEWRVAAPVKVYF